MELFFGGNLVDAHGAIFVLVFTDGLKNFNLSSLVVDLG